MVHAVTLSCPLQLYAAGTLLYGLLYPISPSYRVAGEVVYFGGVFWMLYLTGKTAYGLYTGSLL